MTIAIVLPDRIIADSRLSGGVGERPLTVGKVFRRKGGGLFVTTGDSHRTAAFERAMSAGQAPAVLQEDGEGFDGAVLQPDGRIVYYDASFAPFPIAETWLALGGPELVANSWMAHLPGELSERAVLAVARCIEVHDGCGYPIQVVPLKGKPYQIEGPGAVAGAA